MNRKAFSVALSVFLAFAVTTVFAALQATIGGINSDGNYHFTVDSDGLLAGAPGSTVQLVSGVELVSTGTFSTLTTADSGKDIIVTSGAFDFTLPDCDTDVISFSITSAVANPITIDTYSTEDTINYKTLDAGDAIDSAGAIGDSVTLTCYTADTWLPTGMGSSAWTDGGAD